MDGMLRFSGSVRRAPAIDVWLNEQATELGADISLAHTSRIPEGCWWVPANGCAM